MIKANVYECDECSFKPCALKIPHRDGLERDSSERLLVLQASIILGGLLAL